MFGEMTEHYALCKVYAPGTSHDTEYHVEMKGIFDEAYAEAIFSKFRWNGFKLNTFEEKKVGGKLGFQGV